MAGVSSIAPRSARTADWMSADVSLSTPRSVNCRPSEVSTAARLGSRQGSSGSASVQAAMAESRWAQPPVDR